MKPDAGLVVDHKDGNTLDNRRENLRICTNAWNAVNRRALKNKSAPYKGVRAKRTGKFDAIITIDKKQIYLGTFKSPESAKDAYDKAAEVLHGEYRRIGQ